METACLSPFLDCELLNGRDHVFCCSLTCSLSTSNGPEAPRTGLLTTEPLGPHVWLPVLQFLAYDTQLVLGNRRHTISPEDYITGALQIYTDIVYIFTFVLQLLGDRN